MTGGQRWRAPTDAAISSAERSASTAVAFSPAGWWFVTWRARVLDESTGNVEARVAAVAHAMEQIGHVGGRPAIRSVAPSGVTFDFWFEAASPREVFGGARVALRQAFKAAGVGDPTSHRGNGGVADVMLMLEELPMIHRDGP